MIWSHPAGFVLGLFAVILVGVLLPIRIDRRQDHIILTISSAVAAAILGAPALALLWGAVGVAMPLVVGWCLLLPSQRERLGWRAARRTVAWNLLSAFAITVGFVCANLVYTGSFGRDYPIRLDSTPAMAVAAVVGVVSWVGTMSVRLISIRWLSGPVLTRSLDPLESHFLPYVLPLISGFPVVVACIAMYRPDDPWPALIYLWWCVPIYAATAIDLHRRRLAIELRRDVFAKQRLAAIGEVSARIVHQSRHQVGLMGWSIHRLRTQLASDGAVDSSAVQHELDALAEAKDRLSEMLTAELLHEGTPDGVAGGEADGPTQGVHGAAPVQGRAAPLGLAELVAEVCDQLRAEAEREGVDLRVEADPAAAAADGDAHLRDVVFNLVDNAIDAAAGSVVVRVEPADGGTRVVVADDGPGMDEAQLERAFEPFFTTKGDGTGMGLAIADAIVGGLGGELRYERVAGMTRFVVVLPQAVVNH